MAYLSAMVTARLLTIGTEITSGEVVNSNAAWVSRQLEDLGVRVFSHLSVRDERAEIMSALRSEEMHQIVVVTGGLGPTSDDITRECVAEYAGRKLEFDDGVWRELEALYSKRGLPLREAHKQQCYFPEGSARLANPVGTALGFRLQVGRQEVFVLPGPPRELEGIWMQEIDPRLRSILPKSTKRWVKWTCLGAPESEVAEVVERVLAGSGTEVGYRAQIPYVRVKVYVEPEDALIAKLEAAMKPWIVARGNEDLAEELLKLGPISICDEVCGQALFGRLPGCEYHSRRGPADIVVTAEGEEAVIVIRGETFRKTLPYKVPLNSERGKRSLAEWVIWLALSKMRATSSR